MDITVSDNDSQMGRPPLGVTATIVRLGHGVRQRNRYRPQAEGEAGGLYSGSDRAGADPARGIPEEAPRRA
jgi:hypothetical protein